MSEMDTYRALYIAESRENHETIVKNLLVLENGPDEAAIAEIFRSAHSLKGMSATMGFQHMERICHAMEDVFQLIRSGQLEVHQELVDLLLAASDDIEQMLDDIESGGPGTIDHLEERVQALLDWEADQHTPARTKTGSPERENNAEAPSQKGVETLMEEKEGQYRMLIRLRDDCDNKNLRGMLLLQNLDQFGTILQCIPDRETVEDGVFDGTFQIVIRSDAGIDALKTATAVSDVKEVLFGPDIDLDAKKTVKGPVEAIKQGSGGPGTEREGMEHVPGVSRPAKEERSDKSREVKNIRVDIARLDQMMNLIEDLVINRGRLAQIARKFQIKELDETLNMVGRSVSDLQNLMMNIRMIPLSHIFNRFPRTVRDLAHKEEKEVEFTIEGGDTELDRSIMDGLNDPLLHLIRNAVDHGIEKPEIRIKAGKPGKGTLNLIASRDRDNVVIVIEDDGAGINREKVAKKAIERGLITEQQASEMTDEAVYDLLFLPGFSTAEKITDVSGRGVGLDVVRTAIDNLKGTIKVESSSGKGSRFELVLPPTMAIVNVLMVRINNRRCAIPVNNVVEVAGLSVSKIHHIGTQEAIMMRDEVLPLDRLDDMFGKSDQTEILVVLQHQNKKRTIAVDLIEGQQEVVIKPLSSMIGGCRGISGITIPGDGEVVPVLDVNAIVKEN
jgi:two-component system, chemotaxis family, sensor kinase CheA